MTPDMSRDHIQDEFDKFFEFDGPANKTSVTSVSCRLFADHIARRAVAKALQRAMFELEKPYGMTNGSQFVDRLRLMASEAIERAKW